MGRSTATRRGGRSCPAEATGAALALNHSSPRFPDPGDGRFIDLSRAATQRGHDYAELPGGPGMLSFTRWYLALGLMRLAARNRAAAVLSQAIDDFAPSIQLTASDTTVAQMVGLMHLTSAQTAARSGSSGDAHSHLDEADRIARRVGERNALRRHFGPTNIAAWRLAVGIGLSEGARAYADTTSLPIDVQALGSSERTAVLHLDGRWHRRTASVTGLRSGTSTPPTGSHRS
ncbi:MAG: hypothetical protein ACRDSR_10670 [Pseudonocardiaceae bacterium]